MPPDTAPARKAKPALKEDRQFVTALARGLEIMRCFTAQRSQLGTTEIAQITGLPQPTVWRLCHTLVTLGYLVPGRGRDKLRVGAPVLALGYAALAELDYVQIMRPHMQQLADQFQAAVALAERHQLSMIYLERCQGNSMFLMNLHVGSRIPIYNSAVGWAYLAGLDEPARKATMEELRQTAGASWPQVRGHIENALSDYARDGFIINAGLQHTEVNAAAVPVRSADGSTLLSLNCGGPNNVLTPERMKAEVGPALKELAQTLRVNLPHA